MTSPKLLLFDLGGVLIEYIGTQELLKLMSETYTRETLHDLWLQTEVWFKFEMGQVTPEEFAAVMCRDWHLTCDEAEFLAHFESWTTGLYPGAADLMAEIKPKYRLAALSNSNATHWRRNNEVLGVAAMFERAFSSHELGLRKPDRAIYEHALRELQVSPDETVFFDDLADNIEAARSLGITAYRVRGVEELREALVDNGLL